MTKEQLTQHIKDGVEAYHKANLQPGNQIELGVNSYVWVVTGSGEVNIETDVHYYQDLPVRKAA